MTPPANRSETSKQQQDRRNFLKTAGAAGVVTLSLPGVVRAKDANSKPTGAIIGCGGIANHLLGRFLESGRCNFAALCDVDSRKPARFSKQIEEKLGNRPDVYREYERVLDRKDIDFVVVGTPDHWHAPITIAA
ncbi:MAG: Gfo/Idh/MocA family oxidoreductase, partial [Planctomycetales bacterium]